MIAQSSTTWPASVRVVIATVMSVALPGSGSFYLGRLRSALVALSLVTAGSFAAALLWRLEWIDAGWLVIGVAALTLAAHGGGSLVAALEAAHSTHKRPFAMTLGFMLVAALGMYATQAAARRWVMSSFALATIAMEPNMEHGDRILAAPHGPGHRYVRGQIVALHDAKRNENFVRRLIGLPGDHVEIIDSEVRVNGRSLRQGPCPHGPAGCFVEQSSDGLRYRTLDRQGDGHMKLRVDVGAGQVFVMRDRRDLSIPLDPLPQSWLIGEVLDVWWSYGYRGMDLQRLGLSLRPEPVTASAPRGGSATP